MKSIATRRSTTRRSTCTGTNGSRSVRVARPRRNLSDQRKGAAAVEFAMVAPIAFTFFAAIIILAQAYLMRDTAQHAAYEGARAVIMPGASAPVAEDAARAILTTVGAKAANVDVEPENLTSSTRSVTVTVSIPMEENLWIRAPWIPDNWIVQDAITLEREVE